MKYLRLLRIEDQHIQLAVVFSAGLFFHTRTVSIFLWAIACLLFSCVAFMLNELVDRQDVDKKSWNPVHVGSKDTYNPIVVFLLGAGLTIAGFVLSHAVGLFGWGIVIYILGMLYSWPGVRLKGWFLLDLLTQLAVWIALPVLAVAFALGQGQDIYSYVVFMCIFILSTVILYQTADYKGDKESGLMCTHVILGIDRSLWLSIIASVVSGVLFFVLGFYKTQLWMWVLSPLVLYTVWEDCKVLLLKKEDKKLASLVHYSRRMKFVSQMLLPYIAILWVFSK